MTLPYERTRSIAQTRKFLVDLAFNLKRIPKEVREMAKGCLRHYPDVSHIQEMCEKCPEIMDMKTTNSMIECFRWTGVDDAVKFTFFAVIVKLPPPPVPVAELHIIRAS